MFSVIKEPDYLVNSEYQVDKGATPKMLNCLMYKLSYYQFGELQTEYGKPTGYDPTRGVEIGNKDVKLHHLEDVSPIKRSIGSLVSSAFPAAPSAHYASSYPNGLLVCLHCPDEVGIGSIYEYILET